LGIRLLIATTRRQQQYPLTATALRSALLRLPTDVRFGDIESFMVITQAQIDRFLAWGWDYTERRLQLLQQVSDFPMNSDGVEMLIDLRRRMEGVCQGTFEQVLDVIYQDHTYPVFQHIGQAFRNHITGRQPFVLQALSDVEPGPRRVCDVGCGSGILLGDILEQHPRIQGYGVDVSHTMLDHTRRVLRAWRLDARATLVNGDLRRLPCASGVFDFVIAMEVLEHIPKPLSGMRELTRVLAPGGCLATSIPVQDPAPIHCHVFDSVEAVLEMHRSVGLNIERQQVVEVAPQVPNAMIMARKQRE
jgi:ubiquinone/menaquinone biosynthesis C-methylase UbiE